MAKKKTEQTKGKLLPLTKAPELIQSKVRALKRTGLFSIPELQKSKSGWKTKPFREYTMVFYFKSAARFEKWVGKMSDKLYELGYHRDQHNRVLSEDGKVIVIFGAREVGSGAGPRTGRGFDYIRAIFSLSKAA